MGNAVSVNALRGLLVHDPRITEAAFSDTLSTYSQAGAQPGVPVPQRDSDMVLETVGTTTASGGSLEVVTVRAGGATYNVNGEVQPGAFAWRQAGGSWLGSNGPGVVSGWSPLHTFGSGGTDYKYAFAHALQTSEGTFVVAARRYSTLGVSAALVVLRNVGGTVTTTVLDSMLVANSLYRPCLVALPNDRILLLSTNPNPDGATTYTIAAWVSDDDGASWSQQATTTIRSSFTTADYEPRRLRAAYSRGQVMMVLAVRSTIATTIPDLMVQYASADGGVTFSEVDRTDGDSDNVHTGGAHEVLGLTSGSFALLYCGSSRTEWGANSAVLSKRLASAWARMTRTTPTVVAELANPSAALSVGNQLSDSTELAACVDESGAAYAVAQDYTYPSETLMARSIDGATWTAVSNQFEQALVHYTAGQSWIYGSLTSWNGSLQLVSAWDSTSWPYQLGTTQLGGYSTATVPYWPVSEAAPDRMLPCYLMWVPFWLPATAGWTRAVIGGPTDVLASNGTLTLTCGAIGDAISYTSNGTAWFAGSDFTVAAMGEWIATSGRSELRVLGADGSGSYGVRVRYSGTTVDVIDHYGGGTLGTFTVTAGVKIHVRAIITVSGSSAATVYVGTSAGALSPVKPAVRVVNGAALVSGGAAASSTTVVWNQATQGVSSWSMVAWGTRKDTSNPHAVTIPDTMPGRPFSPQPQLLDYGMSIRAVAGPAKVGDGWDVSNRYDYAISNVLAAVAPSPRQTWRSTDTTAQTLVWELDTTAANVSPLRGPLGALYLGNVNFRTAILAGRNSAGIWTNIGVIDTSTSSSALRWVRAGTIVEPDTSTTTSAGYYWPYASLQGARFAFDTSIGPVRPIGASTEGNWTNAAAKRVRLLTTGSMTGVGSSGTAGAILHRSALLVWNTDADYSAYRLIIQAQPTYEGYFEIGTMVLGHVAAFGRRYSWGRQLTTEANTALTTGRSGVRRSQVLGPTRRSVEFGWTDGTDLTQVRQQGPADYVLATSSGGTEAVATPWDAPLAMAGLVAELRGADTPVVYLPWIERQASGTTYTAAHPDLMMFGRLVSDVSIEVVQGEEWISAGSANGEVVRTSSVRIEEEV